MFNFLLLSLRWTSSEGKILASVRSHYIKEIKKLWNAFKLKDIQLRKCLLREQLSPDKVFVTCPHLAHKILLMNQFKNSIGQIVGAIRVSGSSVENDHAVAQAGADAMK